MTAPPTGRRIDLRRAPLGDLRATDFRSSLRDYWADEAAIHDRFLAVWAGLDDAAWRLPGAAPSDAGGPEWSLLDHVGHVVDWLELATGYIADVQTGGAWPLDEDFYENGDFNLLNESRRGLFVEIPPAALRVQAVEAHARALAIARQLPGDTIRSDAAWGWIHQVFHGHEIDHLTVLEPWADALRARQIGNDPFGPDPQPRRADLAEGRSRFWADAAAVDATFSDLVAAAPDERWKDPVDGGWTLADHVGHVALWFEEGTRALTTHRPGEPWADLPPEGLDAFNDAQVLACRGAVPSELRARYAAARMGLRAAIEAMSDDDWLDPEGFSWAYEDLHGHIRAHMAMVGPWLARLDWPAPIDTGGETVR